MHLDHDVLACVFSFLNYETRQIVVARVCREWCTASRSPSLHRSLHLMEEDPEILFSQHGFLRLLKINSKYIRDLRIRTVDPVVDQDEEEDDDRDCATPAVTSLQILHISGSAINGKIIADISQNLHELALTENDGLNDSDFERIMMRCGMNLVKLCICGNSSLSSQALLQPLDYAPNLLYLDYSDCAEINDDVVDKLCLGFPKLKTLLLNGCSEISDRSLARIADSMHDLEELGIAWCHNFTENGLQYLLQTCPKLGTIDIRWLSNIAGNMLEVMIHHHPMITFKTSAKGNHCAM